MNKKKFQNNAETGDDLSIFAERISQIRLYFCNGINREFSQKTGIDEATTAKICSGTRGVGVKMLEKIACAFPEVDARWLLTGNGNMITTKLNLSEDEPVEAVLQIKLKKDKKDKVLNLLFGEHNLEIFEK